MFFQLFVILLQIMKLFLEKSSIISLNIMNSLECLAPSLQENFIIVTSFMEMVGHLFLPKDAFLLILLIIEVFSGTPMSLHEKWSTLLALSASFRMISAYLSTFLMLFLNWLIDCSFNLDLTTNVLWDFFVAINYLSRSFTWFCLKWWILCSTSWPLMMDLDS